MASEICNMAKGRFVELCMRVDNNDPANAALIVAVLATAGLEADTVLRDKDDMAALVSGTTNEVTNTNYARKVLTDADLTAFTPDDTNDRFDVDIPDQTWANVLAGDGWSKFVVAYDPDTTTGTDSSIVVISHHDFVLTPDGSDITAQIAAAGFARAA